MKGMDEEQYLEILETRRILMTRAEGKVHKCRD
jgi:hypothetical protein